MLYHYYTTSSQFVVVEFVRSSPELQGIQHSGAATFRVRELYGTEPQTAMRILPMDGVSPQLCDFSPIPTWESANVKRYKMTKQQTNYRLGSRCELRCAQVIT